jgi:DNA-binding CsgD family transcriptional regulator
MRSRTPEEFRHELVSFSQRLGFETVACTLAIDHLLGETELITVENTPRGYVDSFQSRANGRVDPVMQHCKRNSIPIIWDQATYVNSGQGDKWEEQARFGMRTGIAMALHLPDGRHFLLGVERDQPVPEDTQEVTRMVADLQLFAVCAQDAAARVLTPGPTLAGLPNLTPRELESLRWTMEGKTAWEVGELLGITERTAALHLNNATHKLDCVNKHQAVLRALRLGLLR